jgi:DegV family protein with EDD domain
MTVRVVTDSACDLPEALCTEYGIEVVPLNIRFGDREFVDREELSTDEFWNRLRTTKDLPETSAPSVGAFEERFRRLADDGASGIVCINLSSEMSATMQSAQVAAKAVDGVCPISIIDSQTASMGIGNLVLYAARRARDGADLATITAEVEDRRGRNHTFALIDTLDFLRRGGRIGGAQALLGSMLSIKPIIEVIDGRVEPATKVRTRSKGWNFLLEKVAASSVEQIAVLEGQADDLDDFLALLRPLVGDAEIVVGTIGPVVGVHMGPGVLGVTWIARA